MASKLKKLDSSQPYNFFGEASSKYEFEYNKFDEAAIYYYVGLIRYNYYLGVNPGYPPSDGWITTESLRQRVTKRIELYLQTNIDKYIEVLKYAINYCNNNVYTYWEKPKEELMHKKILQPYETLLKDLEANKQKYLAQWQADRERNLDPNSLGRDEVRKKMAANVVSHHMDMSNLMLEAEALRNKIKQEKDNDSSLTKAQNINRLYEIEKVVNDYAKESSKRKITLLKQEVEDLKAANDTTKILYSKAQKPFNVDTAKSKADIYDFYNEQKRINHYKYIKSKEKLAILNYINKKNWAESKKIATLKLVNDDSDTLKTIDKSKDIYITKIEQKKMELETFQNILKANEKDEERRHQIQVLLGETEGKNVWFDVQNIIRDYQNQYTAS
jgi:hypothetical protein